VDMDVQLRRKASLESTIFAQGNMMRSQSLPPPKSAETMDIETLASPVSIAADLSSPFSGPPLLGPQLSQPRTDQIVNRIAAARERAQHRQGLMKSMSVIEGAVRNIERDDLMDGTKSGPDMTRPDSPPTEERTSRRRVSLTDAVRSVNSAIWLAQVLTRNSR